MTVSQHHFEQPITKTVQLDYLFYRPAGYDQASATGRPLVLFLHGAGQRGHDPQKVTETAIAQIIEQQARFGFLLVAPQCPPDTWWVEKADDLIALLDHIIATHAVDESRLYLTGLSMGGAGTWYLAGQQPTRFAAIAPICGASLWWQGFPEKAALLKDIPIWTFHGEADSVVSIRTTEEIVAVLEAQQADVRFTRYPGVLHDSWTQTYRNPALYEWLYQHRLEG